jgi:uncharacterized protein (DUF427 family)
VPEGEEPDPLPYAAHTGLQHRWRAVDSRGTIGGPVPVVHRDTTGRREDTPMRATIDGAVIAEASQDELVRIEGNWYFPPSAIRTGALTESPTPYHCPWKGDCQYFDVVTPGGTRSNGAWSYPVLKPSAIERVGVDFAGYVAFSRGVTVG